MKPVRVALLASAVATLTRVALAQPSEGIDPPVPPPSDPAKDRALAFRHRAFLGLGVGYLFTSAKLNGESIAEESAYGGSNGTTIGFELGLEERFTRLLSLAARARFFVANNDWANSVGYSRARWDLGLEPRLWVQPKKPADGRGSFTTRRVEGYAGVGSGVSLPSETPPPRRAYDERIDAIPGYYISACTGGTLSGEHVAMFIEFGYVFRSTHVVATLEPRAPGVPRTVEERDNVDHSILVSIGVVAGFGMLE